MLRLLRTDRNIARNTMVARCLWLLLGSWMAVRSLSGCAWIRSNPSDTWLQERCELGQTPEYSIGVLLPLSGKYAWYGKTVLDGIQLGMDCHVDDDVGCRSYRLVVRDTQGDGERASSLLQEMVQQEKVVAVLGPLFSEESRAAGDSAQEIGVSLLALSGSYMLPEIGSYVFTNFMTREAEIATLVGYARNALGIQTAAVLYPEDRDGRIFFDLFERGFSESGGRLTRAIGYPADTANFSPIVKQLVGRADLDKRPDFIARRDQIRRMYRNRPLAMQRALENLYKKIPPIIDFEAIFVPDVYEKIAMLAPALAFEDVVLQTQDAAKTERLKKSLGRNQLDMVYLLGTDGWHHPKLIEWAGRYVEGAVFCDGFFKDSTKPATRSFVERFQARYHSEPGTLAAHAYDAARMLRWVLDRETICKTSDLRDALLDMQHFEGACGAASMDASGRVKKELFLLTIRSGRVVELALPLPVS